MPPKKVDALTDVLRLKFTMTKSHYSSQDLARLGFKVLVLAVGFLLLSGCDPHHQNKCEWYLVPEPSLIAEVDEGYIPVCARNYVINKQYCKLQTKYEFAKKVYGKKFRYNDMKLDLNSKFPRKIDSIKLCE